MKLVIFGPPGAGKGTYSEMISTRYGIPHIATGDIIREEIHKGTELGKRFKEYVGRGTLVPDEVVIEIVKKRISQPDCGRGFILDGFPRTIPQAEALDELTSVDSVINLQVSEEIIVKRLSTRRVCKRCGAIYNLVSLPPKKPGVCDKCEGELYQREDDKPEVIRRRLKEYEIQTKPLLEFYEKKSVVKTISLEKEERIEVVAEKIFKLIERPM